MSDGCVTGIMSVHSSPSFSVYVSAVRISTKLAECSRTHAPCFVVGFSVFISDGAAWVCHRKRASVAAAVRHFLLAFKICHLSVTFHSANRRAVMVKIQ